MSKRLLKTKITKNFLMEMQASDKKISFGFRANKKLIEFAKKDAKSHGLRIGDYFGKLLLARMISSNNSNDIFDCIDD